MLNLILCENVQNRDIRLRTEAFFSGRDHGPLALSKWGAHVVEFLGHPAHPGQPGLFVVGPLLHSTSVVKVGHTLVAHDFHCLGLSGPHQAH